jgi:hypothetical protein
MASKLLKDYLHDQDNIFSLYLSTVIRETQQNAQYYQDCAPMHLWDRVLPRAILTLNMLRTSLINPKTYAATYLNRQYEYNRSPMAPPGTIIIAHEMPNSRRTSSPHGQDGWYIGPALEHYCCYTVYINKTRSKIVVETVESPPHRSTTPFPINKGRGHCRG